MTKREVKLVKKIASFLPRAKLAVRTTARLKPVLSMGGWGLGEESRFTSGWSYINPLAYWGTATDAIAEHAITPILEKTGYMVPTQSEIDTAKESVDQLKTNIAERAAVGDPVEKNTIVAANAGEKAVNQMQDSRDKVVELDWVKELLEKYRRYAKVAVGVAGIGFTAYVYNAFRRR